MDDERRRTLEQGFGALVEREGSVSLVHLELEPTTAARRRQQVEKAIVIIVADPKHAGIARRYATLLRHIDEDPRPQVVEEQSRGGTGDDEFQVVVIVEVAECSRAHRSPDRGLRAGARAHIRESPVQVVSVHGGALAASYHEIEISVLVEVYEQRRTAGQRYLELAGNIFEGAITGVPV